MYVVWAFIVILLFLHFDLSEIIAFAHYTSAASPLQKHAHYPCFTLCIFNCNGLKHTYHDHHTQDSHTDSDQDNVLLHNWANSIQLNKTFYTHLFCKISFNTFLKSLNLWKHDKMLLNCLELYNANVNVTQISTFQLNTI